LSTLVSRRPPTAPRGGPGAGCCRTAAPGSPRVEAAAVDGLPAAGVADDIVEVDEHVQVGTVATTLADRVLVVQEEPADVAQGVGAVRPACGCRSLRRPPSPPSATPRGSWRRRPHRTIPLSSVRPSNVSDAGNERSGSQADPSSRSASVRTPSPTRWRRRRRRPAYGPGRPRTDREAGAPPPVRQGRPGLELAHRRRPRPHTHVRIESSSGRGGAETLDASGVSGPSRR
jgi:hypothetical protein